MTESDKNLPSQFSDELIEKITQIIVDNHKDNGGATVNNKAQSLLGEKYYAVAVFQLRTFLVQKRELTKELVQRFVKENSDLLIYEFCVIGTWFDSTGKVSILDVSILLRDKTLAVEVGKKFNQIAIYDLHEKIEINLDFDETLVEDAQAFTDKEILDFIIEKLSGEVI